MADLIPIYSADHELREWVTVQGLGRMQAQGLIDKVVQRKKTGQITRAYRFRREDDPKPSSTNDYVGTPYSYRERLGDGHRIWRLKKLGKKDELRPLFMKVVADCIAISPKADRADPRQTLS